MAQLADAEDRLDTRYGRTPHNPRRVWWLAGALFACAAAVIAWYVWAGPGSAPAATSSVTAEVSGSNITDAHHAEISFTVTGPANHAIACAIDAQTEDFTIVGWKIVEIPASAERTRTFTHTLLTTQQSQAGFVDSCWLT
ncbi:DUF4307 domain-containing protein [Rathayibacter soli]|uniref:DUF4307 domain-containing protein n=1 Tax=Rathayibacter soli TaxID=3144168 RepID=UPI0027E3E505|nr:DUF4307 domain-containing protein [Glaciibacter superstes]